MKLFSKGKCMGNNKARGNFLKHETVNIRTNMQFNLIVKMLNFRGTKKQIKRFVKMSKTAFFQILKTEQICT